MGCIGHGGCRDAAILYPWIPVHLYLGTPSSSSAQAGGSTFLLSAPESSLGSREIYGPVSEAITHQTGGGWRSFCQAALQRGLNYLGTSSSESPWPDCLHVIVRALEDPGMDMPLRDGRD